MSTPFYDLASLVVVPSGYKASKVYAQKPQTTDGQLAFTRSTTATRVNASGLIETVSSNVPRLDYSGGATCPKLLLEPSRTNVVLQSSAFDSASWNSDTAGGTGSVTVTANYATGPDGAMSADRIQITRGSIYANRFQSVSVTPGQQYTATVYLKSLSGTPNIAMLYADAAYSKTITSNWVRYSVTFTPSGSSVAPLIGLFGENSSTVDVLAWGFQIEAGTYPTSLIQTTTAAVTRLADACSKTGISSLIGQTEGTIFFEYPSFNSDYNQGLIGIDDGSGNNRILFYSDTNNRITAQVRTNGVTQQPSSYSVSGNVKVAIAYNSTGFVFYVNGTLRFTGTAVVFSNTMSDLTFNHVGVGGSITDQALLFTTRLTNAQLAELTTI